MTTRSKTIGKKAASKNPGSKRKSSSDPIAAVQAFLAAAEAFDMDAAEALLHPDVVYQNVPAPPARGRTAVMQQLRAMSKVITGFDVEMIAIAADGDTVLTERIDTISGPGLNLPVKVSGTFELKDGQIIAWRDYFDWATTIIPALPALPLGLARMIRSRFGRDQV